MKVEIRTPRPDTFVRNYIKTDNMKEIQLTKGQITLVDNEDYDYLMQWSWVALFQKDRYYAVARDKYSGKKQSQIRMHRVIMNTPDGMEVDHVFHNTLDNRKFIEINGELKQNLRNCTHEQNMMNAQFSRGGSMYIGVYYRKDRKCYTATISHKDKSIHLGHFKTEEGAAIAYDNAAKLYRGEFAILNFK